MKTLALFALLAAALPFAARAAESAASESSKASAPSAEQGAERHPLKGVVVAVLAEKSAVLVKHEAIPDYMSAMTMMFKVDAATLAAAKKGQRITGTLVKKADGFWLEDVQPVVAAPAP